MTKLCFHHNNGAHLRWVPRVTSLCVVGVIVW